MFTIEPRGSALAVDLDWAFRDNGKVVGGAWKQGNGWGSCVGGLSNAVMEWSAR
jgi:hypothetical protein